jgi:large subunit ribosomal protein L24
MRINMKSIKPGKQRKMMYNAPLHKKRKWTSAHLEENLLLKYDKRAIPIVKGDTVRVMRGSFKGHEDKIAGVNVKKGYLEIEGITMSKADGNKIAKPIHPSNVTITKLNLTDKWRRSKLERGLSEEAKKEIEKEAEEQIKEAEVVAEELKKQKELEEKEMEEVEEETEKIEEKPEKPVAKEEPKKKTAEKKEEKKPVPKKKTTPKKQSAKKGTVKKTPSKKSQIKGGKK